MPTQGRGNVERRKYGSRVRVKIGYKDYYGPYHSTLESAREELSRLLEKDRSPREKILWLQELKCSYGVRRGGRHRSYCRGKEYAQSSGGVTEKMNISVGDCKEHEEVPYNPVSIIVDKDEEEVVPAFGIPSCTTGSVDGDESEGVEDMERDGDGVYKDVRAGEGNSSVEDSLSEKDVALPEEVEVNIGSCASRGCSQNGVHVGGLKKSKRKHMVSRFALATFSKERRRKVVDRRGRLDEVPATPQKRDTSPVCGTPEKLQRTDLMVVRWVETQVGAQCFGEKNGASSWDCRRQRGFVGNAPKAIGLNDVVVLTLTQTNGALIVNGDKQWEGRPVVDNKMKRVGLETKVCFQVGSHSNPWYILCKVVDMEEYANVEQMVEYRVHELLPRADYRDLAEAVAYYRSLGKQYRKGCGYVAFKVLVMCFWKGRRCE